MQRRHCLSAYRESGLDETQLEIVREKSNQFAGSSVADEPVDNLYP